MTYSALKQVPMNDDPEALAQIVLPFVRLSAHHAGSKQPIDIIDKIGLSLAGKDLRKAASFFGALAEQTAPDGPLASYFAGEQKKYMGLAWGPVNHDGKMPDGWLFPAIHLYKHHAFTAHDHSDQEAFWTNRLMISISQAAEKFSYATLHTTNKICASAQHEQRPYILASCLNAFTFPTNYLIRDFVDHKPNSEREMQSAATILLSAVQEFTRPNSVESRVLMSCWKDIVVSWNRSSPDQASDYLKHLKNANLRGHVHANAIVNDTTNQIMPPKRSFLNRVVGQLLATFE